MHFNFFFSLTWLNTLFWWNVSYLFFFSSSSIWLNFAFDESSFLLILLNLNELSWNLKSLVSFDESIFSHNLIKILVFTSLSLSLSLSWLKSFLAWRPSLFPHSLMLSQNLISPWWISFLTSLMEWTIPFRWWTLFPKLDELFISFIVFI